MKKLISFLFILSTVFAISACGGSASSDDDSGYIEPDFDTTDLGTKHITLALTGTANSISCSSSKNCIAIIFKEKISRTNYVGIAAYNNGVKIKIYWKGDSLSTGMHNCTIAITEDNGDSDSLSGVNLDMTISSRNSDDTFTVTFNNLSGISIGQYNFGTPTPPTTNSLRAAYY